MKQLLERLAAIVRALRPRQWTKNLLVFAVPLASGTLLELPVLWASMVAFFAFTLCSSATYLSNDVVDREFDRLHPQKCHRPVASGLVSLRIAIPLAFVLASMGVLAPLLLGYRNLAILMVTYLALQAVYQGWARSQPVFDIAVVSAGFVLRAVAGGLAASILPSPAFMAVTASVALFVVAGKRYSEALRVNGTSTRGVLDSYSPPYLRFVWSVAVALAVTFYVLWALELWGESSQAVVAFSIVPFTLILLRYARDVDAGVAEEPEEVILRDRPLLVLILVWLLLFAWHVAL